MLNTKRTLNALPLVGVASLACAVVLAALCSGFAPPKAYADPKADLAAAQDAIEQSAADYDEAQDRADKAEEAIKSNTKRIQELEKKIPQQQKASKQAFRSMYLMQQDGVGLLDVVLGSKDLGSFFTNLQYLNHVQERNLANIRRLSSMRGELKEKQEGLESQKAEAEKDKASAKEALKKAQEARIAAQKAAEEQQRREAEAARKAAAAKKAAAEAKAAKAAAKKAAEEAAKKAEEEARKAEEDAAANSPASQGDANDGSSVGGKDDAEVRAPAPDSADWSTDKKTFVKKWAPRIDAYLAGFPLGGYGKVFASKAWDYGVDPRWSPAISCVESTKGKFCFKPHNAWGWGHSGWSSWEEAIDAHVGGLARGYGYTVTQAAARKYCPPTWRHWYNTCVAEMAKI